MGQDSTETIAGGFPLLQHTHWGLSPCSSLGFCPGVQVHLTEPSGRIKESVLLCDFWMTTSSCSLIDWEGI